jgi:hypothetical protein
MLNMSGNDRFNEIAQVGELYFSGCVHIGEGEFIGFAVDEGYDDEGNHSHSAVIVRCYGGVDGFQFHLSPDQAEALAGMLREAAREIRRNELLSKSE